MIDVRETVEFADWFEKLKDRSARRRLADRFFRLSKGNFGDTKAIGDGVAELRFHFGPGYRVYFTRLGSSDVVVILLAGGDKASQTRDIALARRLAERERQ